MERKAAKVQPLTLATGIKSNTNGLTGILGMKKGGNSGFSLIEVMVVVFLIAIFASVGFMSFGSGKGAVLEAEAKQFTDKLNLLIDESIFSGTSYRVLLNEEEGFYTYEKYQGSKWESIARKPFQKYELPESVSILLNTGSSEVLGSDSGLVVQSDGVVTSFQLLFGERSAKENRLNQNAFHWLVSAGAVNGSLTVVKVDGD